MLVVVVDEGGDLTLEIGHRLKRAAADRLVGDQSEPAFDLVEPRAIGRREVQMKAGPTCQPRTHPRVLVSGVVVTNQMHLERGWHARLDMAQKRQEFLMPVARLALGEDAAIGDIESSK